MTIFKNCFLGVELPDIFQEKLKTILTDLGKIDSNLKLIRTEELKPHITIQFLDTQSQNSLSEIKQIVSQNLNSISNLGITVGGMDYFNPGNPCVIFLKVQYPPELLVFQQELNSKLSDYLKTVEYLEFHPHLTVARMPSEKAQQSFEKNRNSIKALLDTLRWTFKVNELVIFGIDPKTDEKVHQSLFTIPINMESE